MELKVKQKRIVILSVVEGQIIFCFQASNSSLTTLRLTTFVLMLMTLEAVCKVLFLFHRSAKANKKHFKPLVETNGKELHSIVP